MQESEHEDIRGDISLMIRLLSGTSYGWQHEAVFEGYIRPAIAVGQR